MTDENLRQQMNIFEANLAEQERRLRAVEDLWDTYAHTPLLRRLLFALDGWPTKGLAERPGWRPWRRWWVS